MSSTCWCCGNLHNLPYLHINKIYMEIPFNILSLAIKTWEKVLICHPFDVTYVPLIIMKINFVTFYYFDKYQVRQIWILSREIKISRLPSLAKTPILNQFSLILLKKTVKSFRNLKRFKQLQSCNIQNQANLHINGWMPYIYIFGTWVYLFKEVTITIKFTHRFLYSWIYIGHFSSDKDIIIV